MLLLYLMIVSSVAFSLWTLLLRDYSSALVGMFHFLIPVFGTIFLYILSKLGFLNETAAFTTYTVLAIVCSALLWNGIQKSTIAVFIVLRCDSGQLLEIAVKSVDG